MTECDYTNKAGGGGCGDVMAWLASPIRTQLKVIRECLDVLAEQEDSYK